MRERERHAKALRSSQSMMNTRVPPRSMVNNAKTRQREQERHVQILHENHILLNKLSKIITREQQKSEPMLLKSGLHEPYRRQRLESIDIANQSLMKRITTAQPTIDVLASEYEWQQQSSTRSLRQFVPSPFLAAPAGSSVSAAKLPGRASDSWLHGSRVHAIDTSGVRKQEEKAIESLLADLELPKEVSSRAASSSNRLPPLTEHNELSKKVGGSAGAEGRVDRKPAAATEDVPEPTAEPEPEPVEPTVTRLALADAPVPSSDVAPELTIVSC